MIPGRSMRITPTIDRLTLLLRDVFDDDDLVATPELTFNAINGWDSLGKVRLLLEIEEAFAVQISPRETATLESIADLVQLIDSKVEPAVSEID